MNPNLQNALELARMWVTDQADHDDSMGALFAQTIMEQLQLMSYGSRPSQLVTDLMASVAREVQTLHREEGEI